MDELKNELKKIHEYCGITLQPNSECARRELEKFNWNLEEAINHFFEHGKMRPPIEAQFQRLYDDDSSLEQQMVQEGEQWNQLLQSSRKKWKKVPKKPDPEPEPVPERVTKEPEIEKEEKYEPPSRVLLPGPLEKENVTRVQLCSFDQSQKLVHKVYLDTPFGALYEISSKTWGNVSLDWRFFDSVSGKMTLLNFKIHGSMSIKELGLQNAQIFELN